MSNLTLVPPNNVVKNLRAAGVCDRSGKHAHAMLYLNAACYWALTEMPYKAADIREQAERYRREHFVKRNASPR